MKKDAKKSGSCFCSSSNSNTVENDDDDDKQVCCSFCDHLSPFANTSHHMCVYYSLVMEI